MSNNAKLKHFALFAAAILLPPLVGKFVHPTGMLPAMLFSSVAIGVLSASTTMLLPLLIPVGMYGLGCLLYAGDFVSPAIPLMFLPAGFIAGLCMRRKCTRSLTVTLTSAGFLLGLAAEYSVLTYFLWNKLTLQALEDTYNLLYTSISDAVYTGVCNVLSTNAESYGIETSEIPLYTISYMRACRPMLIGTLLLACNVAAYVFTVVAKELLKYINIEKHNCLPGVNGSWEFVLSKSSAVVFILCYVCLFLGGETLTLPQTSAFYALMLAIGGGVFLMAFRALRKKMHISSSNILVVGLALLFFFSSSIINFVFVIISVIGLTATFKQDKKEVEKQ